LINIQTIISLFIIAFLSSIFFTLFVRKILKIADIRDNPIVTEHRHKAGTPTMGGLAILLGILICACIFYTNQNLVLTTMIRIIAVIGCINAVNLIDGMDGLASGILAIASSWHLLIC